VDAVVIPVGPDLYAVPVDWVRHVVRSPRATRLVSAPPCVLGLFNVRGEIVPLFDTAALLGIGTVEEVAYAVILETPHGPAALAATGFPQRVTLDAPLGESELAGTSGTYRVGRHIAALLDPAAALAPERLVATGAG
jgi:purine-binding chemotaxis protein CheW